MTPPEPKACTACAHHRLVDGHHTCAHPPVPQPLTDPDTGSTAMVIVHVDGLFCDIVRKMHAPCGPAGTLWEPRGA